MADEKPVGDGTPAILRCDFCGQETPQVRRIVLDRDYDRIQTPPPVRYACENCSRRKEMERLGTRRA